MFLRAGAALSSLATVGTVIAAETGDVSWLLNFGTLGLFMGLYIAGVLPLPGELKRLEASEKKAWESVKETKADCDAQIKSIQGAIDRERADRNAERNALQERITSSLNEVARARETMMAEVVPALTRTIDLNKALMDQIARGHE